MVRTTVVMGKWVVRANLSSSMRACRGDPRVTTKRVPGSPRGTAELPRMALVFSTELSAKGDCMPTFDQVPLQEAMLKTATGKTAQITKEYLGYIEQLPEDQAGRLQPDEDESVATIRRRLGVAVKLSGKDIIIKRQGNGVYFWEEPYPRLRRQIRRSQRISET